MTLIDDEVRRWADREYPPFSFEVTEHDILRFSRAIGETSPIHIDPESARAAGYSGLVAPPHFCYVIRMHGTYLVSRSELEKDGSSSSEVPPVPHKRAMAGELSAEFCGEIVSGDVITVEKRVTDLYEKEGKSGPMVFVTFEYSYRNQRNETVSREQFTRIYL
jgi:hydroxyacyl-ACP dehydratase HTD2-like protein with hotdog domain